MYEEVKNTNINKLFFFFRLRVRIKALQQTIDTQSVRITDLISSQVLASMNGRDSEENTIFVVDLHTIVQVICKFQNSCLSAMRSEFISVQTLTLVLL